MDRRDFLKTTSTLVASGAISKNALAEAFSFAPETPSGRLVLPINRNWRYNPQLADGFQAREFDDSGFERVVVPHTNKRLPWHSFDEKSYEFVSAYRRHFKLPAEARGKHVFVDFEGVMTASTVWVNGHKLGEYKGGYTPFSFELTPHLDWSGNNVLAVAVDSTERPDIPPFGYEINYLTFGGIYREVSLRIVPSTFIDNIFAKSKDVLSGHPNLDVDCLVQHLEPSGESLRLQVVLLDGDRVIDKAFQQVLPSGPKSEPVPHTIHFTNLNSIKLW